MIGIATVLVAVAVSLLVTRIATLALTATGMTREAARFQARSAFTGVGFTTGEAERVVTHPVRRRVIMTLMLLGNAGIITVAAGVIFSLARSQTTPQTVLRISVLLGGLLILLWLSRTSFVTRLLQHWLGKALARWTDIEVRDLASLLQISGEYGISELHVRQGDWLEGKTLAETQLRDEGATVLGIQRGGHYLGLPRGGSRVVLGDILILYGPASVLHDLDRRKEGASGDAEHRQTVARKND